MVDDLGPRVSLAWTAWTLPLGRLRGIHYRASWTLGVLMLFDLVAVMRAHHSELAPLALVVPPLVILLHFWGHALALRLVGGHTDETVLWMLGDSTHYHLRLAPWPQFLVPFTGILASSLLWFGCDLALQHPLFNMLEWEHAAQFTTGGIRDDAHAYLRYALELTQSTSASVAFWNLLPHMTFDGGRMWRAILWPLLGLKRAVWITVIAGMVVSGLLTVFGIASMNFIMLMFGISMCMASAYEYRSLKGAGFDPVLEIEPGFLKSGRSTLLSRWQERRRQRRLERIEREESQEQEILDQLLAKVSAQGLPSLTVQERATLARISKKQKERQHLRA